MDVSFDILGGLFFHLTRRQIFQCAMRSFGIVKLNIGSDTCLKFARTHLFCQHKASNDNPNYMIQVGHVVRIYHFY